MTDSILVYDTNGLVLLKFLDDDTHDIVGDYLALGVPKEETVFLLNDSYWKVVYRDIENSTEMQYTLATVPCKNKKLKRDYVNIVGTILVTEIYITKAKG